MAGEDVLWSLDADGSNTIATLDEIDASLSALSDSIAAAAASAGDLTAIDDAMAELSAMTQQGAADAAALDSALATVGDAAMAATDSVGTLAASLDTVAGSSAAATAGTDTEASATDALMAAIAALTGQVGTLAASIDGLAASEEGAAAGAESAGAAMEGLQAAMGPLMMIGTVAALVGGKIVGMGLDGQKGEALLRGMAGASQSDIQALQSDAVNLGLGMDQASQGFYQVASAGYAGKDAISVFDAATKLAEGGQASEADTLSALTAIMHDYNASAGQATHYTDLMDMAVVRGKQSMSDFATAIGPLASAGENVGLSFEQVAAAEATMTQINPHVEQDAQQLAALFKSLSPTMGGVVKAASDLGLSFDKQKYSSLDLMGKLQYLADLAGGTNTAAFVKLTGGVQGSTAAIDLMKNKGSAFKDNLVAMGQATGATEKSFAQWENTIPAHLNKVGAALSVFATKLMDALGPKLIPIIDKVSVAFGNFANYMITHGDALNAALAALAAVIGGILVAAVVTFVATAWPVILAIAAIAAVVGVVVYAFQHWGQIMGIVNAALKIPAIHDIMLILQQIGAFLVTTFTPVWQQLVTTFNTQLLPAWKELQAAVVPMMPLFQGLGIVIGFVVALIVGELIGMIRGLIQGFAVLLQGMIQTIGGIVQMFAGLMTFFSGFFAFLHDLFSGNWSKLLADMQTMFNGMVNVGRGFGNVMEGLFKATFGAIIAFVAGFVTGIVQWFQTLYNDLVGHSIIPNMINGIIQWFALLPGRVFALLIALVTGALQWFANLEIQAILLAMALVNGVVQWFATLPGRAVSAVSALAGSLASFFGGLASQALSWGSHIVGNLISGIQSMAGSLAATIGNIAGQISSVLGHSTPSVGPLADDDQWMSHMIDNFVADIHANQGKLKAATLGMTMQMAQGIAPPSTGITGGGTLAPLGSSAALPLLAGILQALQQQQQKPGAPAQPAAVTMYNTNSLYGIQNIQDMANSLNNIAGYAFESGQRGIF